MAVQQSETKMDCLPWGPISLVCIIVGIVLQVVFHTGIV